MDEGADTAQVPPFFRKNRVKGQLPLLSVPPSGTGNGGVEKTMRKNSIKNVRINSEVQRELSRIIREEVKDPRIDPMVSVTRVQVAPDLKTCKVYISVLGGAESMAATMEGLRRAEGFIRRELAHTVNLRNTPELTFIPDTSIEYGVRMSKKIEEVSELYFGKKHGEDDADEPDTGDAADREDRRDGT